MNTIKIVFKNDIRTVWQFDIRTNRYVGTTYRVITYPDSSLIWVETWEGRRPVSELQGSKLYAKIRIALAKHAEGIPS